MKKILSLILLFLLSTSVSSQDSLIIPITDFDPSEFQKENLTNPKWNQLTLPRRDLTTYKLVDLDKKDAIKAESVNSASGLVYQIEIDPSEYPVIEWTWKVNEVIPDGNLNKKKGDDYAARIYITFNYDKRKLGFGDRIKYEAIRTFTRYEIPLRAINYIWANKAEKGTIAPNPYTDWVYMIAVQSGDNLESEWKSESRNIYQDYISAFGEAPPSISGVAIMTDSDDTKSSSMAWYGDIIFRKSE